MNSKILKFGTALAGVFALALLGGCAYDGDDGHYRGGYAGGGYYEPDYYSGSYRQPYYIPYGGYGGGYRHHDGERYRGDRRDGEHDGEHGQYRGHNHDENRDQARNQAPEPNRGERRDTFNPAPQNDLRGDNSDRARNPGNYLPNGQRITRGTAWKLGRPEGSQ